MDSLIAFGLLLVAIVIVFSGGIAVGIKGTQDEAAKHNVGEYVADKQTGKTQFVWKELK